jgi:hypothetical protein
LPLDDFAGIEKPDVTLKWHMENYRFRSLDPQKNLHERAFNTSNYLNKTQSIEKALHESSRFDLEDKFYTKKKFEFRAPQPLKQPAAKFCLTVRNEQDRVNQRLRMEDTRANGSFNMKMMI